LGADFGKILECNISMKIRSVGSGVATCGRTNRRTGRHDVANSHLSQLSDCA